MEGFSYPVIDEKQCMNCKLCEKVCPVKLRRDYRNIKLNLAYACINVNEEVRFDSSSGGIFSLLAEAVIDKQGIVYGAAFAADGSVYHVGVTTKDKIRILRGAKYLQSNLQDAFKEIRDALENDQIVLFSGTPCQNAGLRAYLGSDYKNLYRFYLSWGTIPFSMEEISCLSRKKNESKKGEKVDSIISYKARWMDSFCYFYTI